MDNLNKRVGEILEMSCLVPPFHRRQGAAHRGGTNNPLTAPGTALSGSKRWPGLVLLCGGLLATPAVVSAIKPEDVLIFSHDPVIIRPQFGLTEMYSDNILYRTAIPEADLVTVVSPGFNFQLGRETDNHFTVKYVYDHLFYARNTGLNSGEHTFNAEAKYQSGRFKLEGRDRVQFLSSPIGGGERSSLNQLNVDRGVFSDNYTLTFTVSPKTSVYAEGTHEATDYSEGVRLFDYNTVTGTGGFSFQYSPKTAVFGEMYYGQTATSPNTPTANGPHATFIGGFAGVRVNFDERLTGTVKAGYEAREFSDGTPTPSAPVVEVALNYRLSELTRFSLNYSRRTRVSVQFASQSFTYDSAGLQLNQFLGAAGKFSVALGGTYSMYEYDSTRTTARRADNFIRAYGNVTYRIRLWFSASLGYELEKFNSDQAGVIDYDVNRVILRLTVGY